MRTIRPSELLHRRRLAAAAMAVFAGAVMVGFGATGTMRAALADTAGPTLGTYSLVGDSTGVIASEDEPSANAHPEGQGSAPESSTMLTNGPVGYGLSAVGWPGATEANAGGLVVLLFPGPVGNAGVPVPDALTQAVDQNAGLANYPIRAEARAGQKPDATYSAPAVDLSAHADAAAVSATAHIQGAQQPSAQASYGDTKTQSSSTLNGTVGKVSASSTATNINIAGVVKIGSITSSATAQTNGATSSGSGNMIVSNMTIAGQPAYVDQNGVHIGSQGQNPNPVVNQIAEQALNGAGIHMYLSKPLLQTQGATTTYSAGSLIILWEPPGDPSQNVFTASFGGARVSVTATPGTAFNLPVPPVPPAPSVTPPPSGPTTPVSDSSPLSLPAAPSAPATPTRRAVATGPISLPSRLVSARTFGGISVGWVILGLAGVGLVLAGSRRLASDLLDRPIGSCPLESSRP